MNRNIMIGLAVLFAIPLIGNAENKSSKYSETDKNCPILVKYIGTSTNNCTISGTTVTIVADGLSQSKQLATALTVNDMVTWLNAITNESGHLLFKSACWEAITTDTLTNKLINATNKVIDSAWDTGIFKWDTSAHLSYNVVCDTPSSEGIALGNYQLEGIFGDPTGTGNVTLNVYGEDTILYQKTFTSPFYVVTSVGTTNTTADNTITLESGNFPGIHIGAGQKALIRATRASTATTGGVGASVSR